ncbi:MAG: hypothetical protein C0614_12830 [Desulfuromonas sp.]|nr:MAG: hypothetical protein C0614_12830 [Desulfuromonas sp.]
MDDLNYLPISAAAQELHSTELNVLMHIKRGLLQGKECDGGWWVERVSLDALLMETGGGKAGNVCASGCAKKGACGSCH